MKPPIRGIVVCVNYDDLLEITLWRNMRHLTECVVITTPTDERTKEVCRKVPNVRVFETDAFTRFGAKFNKGLAMEEGFDFLGRHGWILIWDADTLFPDELPSLNNLYQGRLYNAPRLILADPTRWRPDLDWSTLPISNDKSFPGYFQLFYAGDRIINQRPWYDVTFAHAGGGDGYFESRWPNHLKIRMPEKVLHLGPRDTNWFGRASPRRDGLTVEEQEQYQREMRDFLSFKGWAKTDVDVTTYNEKVAVPGATETGYKLRGRFDRAG